MKFIEMTGKNVDDAIRSALAELNVTKDKVDIEILDEGKKGFLTIGSRPAKVKIKVKKNYSEEARSFLEQILHEMNVMCEIRTEENDDALKINLVGPNMGVLIGHRGETLDALQYLVSLAVNKDSEGSFKRIMLDTENYRFKREQTLKSLASKLAYKVIKTGSPVKLEPMNPYERRIIHSSLQNDSKVTTYSEGDEPFRRVVIDIKK